MSIAEAMVHGAVPVSSEYTGIHVENVIRPNETGVLFPVGRPDMAADRIVEWIEILRDLRHCRAPPSRRSPFGIRWSSLVTVGTTVCLVCWSAIRAQSQLWTRILVQGWPTWARNGLADFCVVPLLTTASAPSGSQLLYKIAYQN